MKMMPTTPSTETTFKPHTHEWLAYTSYVIRPGEEPHVVAFCEVCGVDRGWVQEVKKVHLCPHQSLKLTENGESFCDSCNNVVVECGHRVVKGGICAFDCDLCYIERSLREGRR